jgi:penicillin-binding protein 2
VLLALPWLLFIWRVWSLQTGESAAAARNSLERSRDRESSVPPRRGSLRDRDGRLLAWDESGFDLLVDPRELGVVDWECTGCGRAAVTREEMPSSAAPVMPPRPGPPDACACAAPLARWRDRAPAARAVLAEHLGVDAVALEEELAALREAAWTRALAAAGAGRARHHRTLLLEELGRLRKLRADVPRAAALEVYVHNDLHRGIVVDAEPVRRVAPDLDASMAVLVGTTGPVHAEEVERLRAEGLSTARIYRMRIGRSGVERSRDEALRGTWGREVEVRDARGNVTERRVLEEVGHGRDIYLSVSTELTEAGRNALGSRHGGLIAMDLHSGEILALAGESPEGFHGAVTACRPGSVMKVLTALAALHAGKEPPDGSLFCRGRESRPIRCTHNHGAISLEEAISGSCNVYFWRAGVAAGADALSEMGRRLRIDRPYGIGVSLEGGGTDWSQEFPVGRPWKREHLANVGIGQGPIEMSPLHVAALYAAIANGGRPISPTLVRGEGDRPVASVLDAGHLRRIRTGLEATIVEGTARNRGLERHRAAGKTGTAQISAEDRSLHAWFAGYAPAENPRVVVVVVVHQQDGSGGDVAAPIAARFLDAWEKWGGAR